MSILDKCKGGVPVDKMVVFVSGNDGSLRDWYLTRELNNRDCEVVNVYPVTLPLTMSPPTPASSTDYWIDNYFTISPPKSFLTHELEPARIEPSKLFLKLMERI